MEPTINIPAPAKSERIYEICRQTKIASPVEIMELLMDGADFPMHGPDHHFLIGAALLTSYVNSGGKIDLAPALAEMEKRTKQVPGGACGFWGACGAAVSAGMFISIVTGSTPIKNQEWKLSNLMTAAALQTLGEIGGPRCCKRNGFLAVQTACRFAREHLQVEMPCPEALTCHYFPRNPQCIKNRCPFHPTET